MKMHEFLRTLSLTARQLVNGIPDGDVDGFARVIAATQALHKAKEELRSYAEETNALTDRILRVEQRTGLLSTEVESLKANRTALAVLIAKGERDDAEDRQ